MVSVGYTLMCEQAGPKHLVDHADDVAQGISLGPDVDRHVEAVKKFVDAGFTHVAIVQIGGDSQPTFLDWAQEQLLPRLREL